MYFNYLDHVKTEEDTFDKTSGYLKGYYEYFPNVIELFFILQQSFGEFDDVKTESGEVQSVAYSHYVQLPYTFKSIYDLTMKGYYLESQILVRHLFETLAFLRYFSEHPDKLSEHIDKNIHISKMIKTIATESYEYYRRLCTYAHGFIMKDIHRTDRKEGKTYLGNRFVEDFSTTSINWTFELALGFLNCYELIFKNNNIDSTKQRDKFNSLNEWLVNGRNDHIKRFPQTLKFHKALDDLLLTEVEK